MPKQRAPVVGLLRTASVVAFVPTRNPKVARRFYEKTLGLKLVSEDEFALVFTAAGITVRIANVSNVKDFQPAPFTILGWDVPDVAATAAKLAKKGIAFERFPVMEQDELGVWNSPSGARVAWFKDPDGNILSISSGGAPRARRKRN